MSEPKADAPNPSIWTVVLASSAGTVIEWYDFYLYGSLAVFFSTLFYPANDPTAAVLISVATFATGFVIRPFGAILFGSLGDRLGRKHTFLLTLILMGISTTAVGLLPTYETIGFAAPVALVVLRLVQGLAIGGEYGGAAIYVAEHAPVNRRGFFTSFIQTTATLGFFVAILVVLACRLSLGEEGFRAWGWRIPFLLSALLVVFSIYLRLKLSESPVFEQMRQAGKVSRAPVRESFGTRQGLGYALYALFGATAGLGCVWYTGQFYALYFLQSVLKVDFLTANVCVAVALALGTPLIVVTGPVRPHRTPPADCHRPAARRRALRPHLHGDCKRHGCAQLRGRHRANPGATHLRSAGLRAECRISRRALSGAAAIYFAVASLSHRHRDIRRLRSADQPLARQLHRQYLRRPDLSHRDRTDDRGG